jgi:hypothetical protein
MHLLRICLKRRRALMRRFMRAEGGQAPANHNRTEILIRIKLGGTRRGVQISTRPAVGVSWPRVPEFQFVSILHQLSVI